MPIAVVPAYSGLLLAKLQSQSYNGQPFNGPMLPVFCTAVATGVIQTTLTVQGQVIAPALLGLATGTGIICSGGVIASGIHSKAVQLFGQEGPALQQFCQAIGEATQAHFMTAMLFSDTNGPAMFPRFASVVQQMKSAIISAAPSFTGPKWPDFAEAIATGICIGISSTGQGVLLGAVGTPVGSGMVAIT